MDTNKVSNDDEKIIKTSIADNKIGERFKYSSSLSRACEKTADTLLWKLKKKRQTKNSRSSTDKQNSHSNSSLNLFEIISPRDEKWQIVQDALTNALLGKPIFNLSDVLCCVRQLDEQFVTNVIVDFYETHILKNTLQKLQRRITNVQNLEESWIEFYRKSLPNVILVLSSLKTQQEYVEKITLFEFKRRLTKGEDLKKKITKKKLETDRDWTILQHMFLILQATRRYDNEITDIDILFEEIASVLISPLIGYNGIFVDGNLTYGCKHQSTCKRIYDSASTRALSKKRKPLMGIFGESKSLWDISGKF